MKEKSPMQLMVKDTGHCQSLKVYLTENSDV